MDIISKAKATELGPEGLVEAMAEGPKLFYRSAYKGPVKEVLRTSGFKFDSDNVVKDENDRFAKAQWHGPDGIVAEVEYGVFSHEKENGYRVHGTQVHLTKPAW
jgi:hypothetical protein